MQIPERIVAEVVKEVSGKMSDTRYVQGVVGGWVQEQPDAARYLTAHVKELGGAEGVVNAVFHASLLGQCFARQAGRRLRSLTFADLDFVAKGDQEAELARRQPALHDYLVANVESAPMKQVLILVGLALDHVS